MSHEPRKIGIRSLGQQVVVIRHQAERRNPDIPHGGALLQKLHESPTILLPWKNHFTASAPVHHMEPSVWILNA
jgi:hypothetical protein